MTCLLVATAFATWSWFRPYEWNPNTASRCKVVETLVTRDESFFWVNVHLKVNPKMNHDLKKPVHLEISNGNKLTPADTTFVGKDGQAVSEIWLKFWVEPFHLKGPLHLHLNDGTLSIKSSHDLPNLKNSEYRNFVTNRW